MPLSLVRRSVRRTHRAAIRRRPYQLRVKIVDGSTSISRQHLLAPVRGYHVRLIRVKVLQTSSAGRHLWELFFGDAGNMITAPNRSIDVLAVPDAGSAVTRTYSRSQGPRVKKDEVLSGRWRGVAPTSTTKIIMEYTEEA